MSNDYQKTEKRKTLQVDREVKLDEADPIVDTTPPNYSSEPEYRVPKGRSLNCRAGIVGPGNIVTSEMVIGGIETLEHLASVGGLVKE